MTDDIIRQFLDKKKTKRRHFLSAIAVVLCCGLTGALLYNFAFGPKSPEAAEAEFFSAGITDAFNSRVRQDMENITEQLYQVKKVYWINDGAQKAPKPDQTLFGETDDPASLQWLLDEAADLLEGQDTLFTTETELMPGTKVRYYLDDTILAITWKQIMGNFVYTISEVKIAHPSQFRRYLAGEEYDSFTLATTSRMAQLTNSVVGTSADYYRGRKFGIIVYDGEVKRVDSPGYADTCYIDKNGDLHFSYRGDLMTVEEAQKFVDERDIQFSLAFGPILVDNGVRCEPLSYSIGEVNDKYSRAVLGQRDKLHYLVITANHERAYWNYQTIHDLAFYVEQLGCQKAYTLDGGNTGTITMNGEVINRTEFGYERILSDIIYFGTAIPHHNNTEKTSEVTP